MAYGIDTEKRSINMAKDPNFIPHPISNNNDSNDNSHYNNNHNNNNNNYYNENNDIKKYFL